MELVVSVLKWSLRPIAYLLLAVIGIAVYVAASPLALAGWAIKDLEEQRRGSDEESTS